MNDNVINSHVNKNKKNSSIFLILVIFLIVAVLASGTYAYWTWATAESERTVIEFCFGEEDDEGNCEPMPFMCAADGGGNITPNDENLSIVPANCNSSGNSIVREVTVTSSIDENGNTVIMNLWLDVISLGSGLSSSSNFKYVLSTSSDSCSGSNVVTSGTFGGVTAGDRVYLLNNKQFIADTNDWSNTETYYLYIWLDAAETSITTANQSFEFSLNGDCSMGESITFYLGNASTDNYVNSSSNVPVHIGWEDTLDVAEYCLTEENTSSNCVWVSASSNEITTTHSFNKNVSGSTLLLYAYVRNDVGTILASKNATINLDNTPPAISLSNNSDNVYSCSKSITVTLSDYGSGLAGDALVSYIFSDSNTENPSDDWWDLAELSYTAGDTSTSFEVTWTDTGNYGSKYLWVKPIMLEDNVGNVNDSYFVSDGTFNFDCIAPTLTFGAQHGSNVVVNLQDAGGSGIIADIQYAFSTSNTIEPTNYQNAEIINLPDEGAFTSKYFNADGSNLGSGIYYLWVKAITFMDGAGNSGIITSSVSSVAYTFVAADTSSPVITLSEEESEWSNEAPLITVTISDDNGIAAGANVQYGFSLSPYSAPTSLSTATLNYSEGDKELNFNVTSPEGEYYLWIVPNSLSDISGNITTETVVSYGTFKYDISPPTARIVSSNPSSWSRTKTVSIVIEDNYSGLSSDSFDINYAWSLVSSSTFNELYTVTISGEEGDSIYSKTVSVYGNEATGSYNFVVFILGISDALGNTTDIELFTDDEYNFDNTGPILTLNSQFDDIYEQEKTVGINVSDSLAGLLGDYSIKYGWSTSSTVAPTSYEIVSDTISNNVNSYDFEVTGSGLTGDYYLWIKPDNVKDSLGNNADTTPVVSSGTFKFDNTGPTISYDVSSEVLSINDYHSGLSYSEFYYGWSSSVDEEPMELASISLTVAEGTSLVDLEIPISSSEDACSGFENCYLWIYSESIFDNLGNYDYDSPYVIEVYLNSSSGDVSDSITFNMYTENSEYLQVQFIDFNVSYEGTLYSVDNIYYGFSESDVEEPSYDYETSDYSDNGGVFNIAFDYPSFDYNMNHEILTGGYYLWVLVEYTDDGGDKFLNAVSPEPYLFDNDAPVLESYSSYTGENYLEITLDEVIEDLSGLTESPFGYLLTDYSSCPTDEEYIITDSPSYIFLESEIYADGSTLLACVSIEDIAGNIGYYEAGYYTIVDGIFTPDVMGPPSVEET